MRHKINILIISLIVFITFHSFGQKEAANWYFGWQAGITFNTNPSSALTNSKMTAYGGCSSISDPNGNLQFYTNGNTIFNKNHDTMLFGSGMMGDYTYGNWGQSVIIVPRPTFPGFYYIFSINRNNNLANMDGLRVTTVSMFLQGGLGAVIGKNHMLLQKTLNTRISAVKHKNGKDYWVIVHEDNTTYFYTFLVNSGGVQMTPIVSSAGREYLNPYAYSWWNGSMKVSPNGKKIAMSPNLYYAYYYGYSYDSVACELFDFNDSSGIVSNPIKIKTGTYNPYYYWNSNGIEFSSDSKKLYLSENMWYSYAGFNIYQFDLKVNNQTAINNSRTMIGTSRGYSYYYSGLMQLGPDGKIYIAKYYSQYLAMIHSPNDKGPGCCFQDSGIYLGSKYCMNGLPNYPQSFFYLPDVTFVNTCFGDTTRFKLNFRNCVDSVLWDFGDPVTGENNSSRLYETAHKFSAPGNYRVFLTKYKSTGKDTSTWFVTINPVPQANFTINDSVQCFRGNQFIYTDKSTISKGSVDTFNWNIGEGPVLKTKNVNYSYTKSGIFNVKLTAISNKGCKHSTSKIAIVLPSPVASFTINDSIQCLASNNFNFSNSSNNYNFNQLKFLWNLGDTKKDTTIHVNHIYLSGDTFFTKLVATNQFDCSDSVSHRMIVSDLKAEFTINNNTQCFAENLFLLNDKTINSPVDSFTTDWFLGDGNSFPTQNISHSYAISDTYNIRLVVADIFGCKDTSDKKVFVHPSPVADFSVDTNLQCLKNNRFVLKNNGSLNSLSGNWNWNLGDGNTSTLSDSVIHSYLLPDTFTIKLQAINQFLCKDSANRQVTLLPSPEGSFSVDKSSQCFKGNKFTFSNVVQSSIISRIWNFGDGNTNSLNNPVTYTFAIPGTYATSLTVTNNLGCKDSSLKNITVFPSPDATFNINKDNQCFSKNNFIFDCILQAGTNNYLWTFGDGLNSTAGNSVNHTYSIAGFFDVTLLITNSFSCTDTSVHKVTVQTGPVVTFSINDTTQCLKNNQLAFSNHATYSGPGNLIWLWNFGDGNTNNSMNPGHHYTKEGFYNATLIAESSSGCKDSLTKGITIFPQPTATFDLNRAVQCESTNSFQLTNTSNIASGSYTSSWDLGDGNTSVKTDETHSYDTTGKYRVKLKLISDNNCADSTFRWATVLPTPVADFAFISDSCSGKVILINTSTNANSFFWDFGDGYTDNHQNTEHRYFKDGNFQVTLITNKGQLCTSSKTSIISIVNLNVFIPAAFSPNDDGINDIFSIQNLSIDCATKFDYKFKIYNRWGEKVFESTPENLQWDGTCNGTKVEMGVYYVVLNSIRQNYSGTLTVLY